jgi:glyoxalase family protein
LTPRLLGIHHITAITGDAPRNVDFYARVLGLRMVKKTVNYDAPDVYHLYYADEIGSPGTVLTFFEFPGAAAGTAGAGMIHTIRWWVAGDDALAYWSERLAGEGVATQRSESSLSFADSEGLRLELIAPDPRAVDREWTPRSDVPGKLTLRGFAGVRAYSAEPQASHALLRDTLGFAGGDGEEFRLGDRGAPATYIYDAAPSVAPVQGAGSVHHIAWESPDEEHPTWRQRLVDAGAHPTPIIDRTYFHSVYFREPSGVLFEIATSGPGFLIDEPLEHLGESLVLPARYEPLRPSLETRLTPITNPRGGTRVG